jgi:hypothetical protein
MQMLEAVDPRYFQHGSLKYDQQRYEKQEGPPARARVPYCDQQNWES